MTQILASLLSSSILIGSLLLLHSILFRAWPQIVGALRGELVVRPAMRRVRVIRRSVPARRQPLVATPQRAAA